MTRFKWTPERLDFLRAGYQTMTARDLAKAFNDHFNLDKTFTSIRATLKNHKITCDRKGSDRLITYKKLFTEDQEFFIRTHYRSLTLKELTVFFNKSFESNFTRKQMRAYTRNHKIRSGRTGYFSKGDMPWNTGTKGVMKPNSGNFKKGSIPANRKPLGSERITKDGFIEIKVSEKDPHTGFPTRYRHKQRHVWEQNFGPVPEGMVVAFEDADKLNCEPENLMLISRAELLTLNRHGYREMPAELKPSVLVLSKLLVKTRAKEKEAV